jgi:hypothetical protein
MKPNPFKTKEEEIVYLEKTIVELENTVEKLEAKISKYNLDLEDTPPCIDFEAMNPFSIERVPYLEDGSDRTVIGYFFENGEDKMKVMEWRIFCTPKQHAELVEEFKKYLEKK